ncbi:MAG: hypothetical protein OXF25_03615 [Cyanobacteria bacterium MAG CAR3_bin_5]|nr:hypothetical protein [Cyanobacteria bacterium MAG CAR3_bin_5]
MIGEIIDAIEIIGRKFLNQQVFDAIRSGKYRSVLKKMMRHELVNCFRRSEMTKDLTREEIKVFDIFLQRMRKLGTLRKTQPFAVAIGFLTDFISSIFSLYPHKISSRNHNSQDGHLETSLVPDGGRVIGFLQSSQS